MTVELSKPSVTVIVTHHLNENQPYLDRCLKGILASENIGFEVIVLASTKEEPIVPAGVTLIWDQQLDNATKKVYRGLELASPKTDSFMLISDDVILNKNAMHAMHTSMAGNRVIMGPCSNNDNGILYWMDAVVNGKPIPLHADIADMQHLEEAIMNVNYSIPVIVRMSWIPYFCIMMPKQVWTDVGGLDPELDSRHNDQDFSYRAEAMGIPTLVNFMAYAFHYGSKTLPKSVLPGEKEKASTHFAKKLAKGYA